MNKTLIVKESHLKLLKELNISWDGCEFGGPCVDPKRPFGNSDVYKDMAEILCQHLTISTGKYECGEYSNIWTKVE